jgi:glycosyltransferase involved in cell wall biosynthesis
MKNTQKKKKAGVLLAANYDSNVGYAWWLMESYWALIGNVYSPTHQVHLCYPSISTTPPIIQSSNITVHAVDFSPIASNLLAQCLFIHRHNIKCIYFSDHPAIKLRYLLYRLFGVKKIIVHDHTPGLRTTPIGLKRSLKNLIMRLPLVNLDAYIGATPFLQQRAIDVSRIPPHKTHHATNGIPIDKPIHKMNIHHTFKIPKDSLVMISSGRAVHYKGIPFVLRCMANLIHKHKQHNLHFLFCGDGPDLNEFHHIVESLAIEKYVTLAGQQQNIASILNACDFAIQPSQGEVGYSLSILEYMFAGLPVIVPNNPSVCSATTHGETGLIYDTDDISTACSVILNLVNDTELRLAMGKKAKTSVQTNFTLHKTHQTLSSVMQLVYPVIDQKNHNSPH